MRAFAAAQAVCLQRKSSPRGVKTNKRQTENGLQSPLQTGTAMKLRVKGRKTRMRKNVHFMSERSDWETPQSLFDVLNREFGCELDVCATAETAKCKAFFSPEDDGLSQEWTGACWMNPPYGREIGYWVKKAYESSLRGATVVCLLPARTDTRWWHTYVMRAEVRLLRGRLRFGNAKNSAPFPSAVVIFRPPEFRLLSMNSCQSSDQEELPGLFD